MLTSELVLSHSRDTFNQLGATESQRASDLYIWTSVSRYLLLTVGCGVPEKRDLVFHAPVFWGGSPHSRRLPGCNSINGSVKGPAGWGGYSLLELCTLHYDLRRVGSLVYIFGGQTAML